MSGRARLVVVAVVALALFAGWRWWNGPERRIARVLDAVADGLSHDQPSTGLAAAAAAAGMEAYLARDVVVEPGRPFARMTGRDTALAAAARIRMATPALRLEVERPQIRLGPDGRTAIVQCTVTARLADGAGQERMDARDVTFALRVVEGNWVIERATAETIVEPVM